MLSSIVDMSRRLGGTCCLHQKGQFRWSWAGYSELSVQVYRITRCHVFVTVHNGYSTVHNGVPAGNFGFVLKANFLNPWSYRLFFYSLNSRN